MKAPGFAELVGQLLLVEAVLSEPGGTFTLNKNKGVFFSVDNMVLFCFFLFGQM